MTNNEIAHLDSVRIDCDVLLEQLFDLDREEVRFTVARLRQIERMSHDIEDHFTISAMIDYDGDIILFSGGINYWIFSKIPITYRKAVFDTRGEWNHHQSSHTCKLINFSELKAKLREYTEIMEL